jgi:hypothetical protein
VEFGTHEFGHMVFAIFGEWLTVAGGSIAQVAIPVLVAPRVRRVGDVAGGAPSPNAGGINAVNYELGARKWRTPREPSHVEETCPYDQSIESFRQSPPSKARA